MKDNFSKLISNLNYTTRVGCIAGSIFGVIAVLMGWVYSIQYGFIIGLVLGALGFLMAMAISYTTCEESWWSLYVWVYYGLMFGLSRTFANQFVLILSGNPEAMLFHGISSVLLLLIIIVAPICYIELMRRLGLNEVVDETLE